MTSHARRSAGNKGEADGGAFKSFPFKHIEVTYNKTKNNEKCYKMQAVRKKEM